MLRTNCKNIIFSPGFSFRFTSNDIYTWWICFTNFYTSDQQLKIFILEAQSSNILYFPQHVSNEILVFPPFFPYLVLFFVFLSDKSFFPKKTNFFWINFPLRKISKTLKARQLPRDFLNPCYLGGFSRKVHTNFLAEKKKSISPQSIFFLQTFKVETFKKKNNFYWNFFKNELGNKSTKTIKILEPPKLPFFFLFFLWWVHLKSTKLDNIWFGQLGICKKKTESPATFQLHDI